MSDRSSDEQTAKILSEAERQLLREKRIAALQEFGWDWVRESEAQLEKPGTTVETSGGGEACEIESEPLGTAVETRPAAGLPPIGMQSSGASHQVSKTPSMPWFKTYLGDCLEILRALPDRSADAVVTDPPYTNERPSRGRSDKAVALRAANRHRDLSINGLLWLMREIALEAQRLVKPTGSLLVFCDAKSFFQMVPVIESAGLRYRNVIIWDKQHFGTGVGFRCQHELIANFCFDKPEYFDQSTGSVLVYKRIRDFVRFHENQKPVPLLRQLIKVVCPPGGVVLDPFMGMGSTGLACLGTGRNFIGVELDRDHFERAGQLLGMQQEYLRAQPGSR